MAGISHTLEERIHRSLQSTDLRKNKLDRECERNYKKKLKGAPKLPKECWAKFFAENGLFYDWEDYEANRKTFYLWKLGSSFNEAGLSLKEIEVAYQSHMMIYRKTKIWRQQEIVAGRPRPVACEACKLPYSRIVYDHCHKKGHFRGWVCEPCNRALGLIRDDPNRAMLLAKYLIKDMNKPESEKLARTPSLKLLGPVSERSWWRTRFGIKE